jgi:hypothetical protein
LSLHSFVPSFHLSCSFQIENVILEIPFPKSVLNVTLTPSQGKYSFDPVNKVMSWDVGKVDPTKLPSIKGQVSDLFGVDSDWGF